MNNLRIPRALTAGIAVIVGLLLTSISTAELPSSGVQTQYTLPHVPGQLLVQYKSGFRDDFIEARLINMGLNRIDRFRAVNMDLVQIPVGFDLERFAAEIGREDMVVFVEPNYIYQKGLTRPNDGPLTYQTQWQLENDGTNFIGGNGAGIAGADLNLINAWDTESLGTGSIIAIIDDAIDGTHEDLAPNIVAGGKCFAITAGYCVDPNNFNPSDSEQTHGTWVAGAAAARGNNGLGGASPAWQAGILPFKTDLDNASITSAINAAITAGAHIINMSFGGAQESLAIRGALASARDAGIIAISSAGNGDANNDRSKAHFPSNSSLPNVISVAASNGYDDIAGFSQWGAFIVELAAPGVGVHTTAVGDNYSSVSGTSFSSPLVAGVAALIRTHTGASGDDAWKQIRAHLLHGGVNGLGLGASNQPGRDRKSFPGRTQTGRLDAARALAGPSGGVLVISGFSVDDTASGNNNGLLDPDESADLVIEVENVWTAETGVTGTLVAWDPGTPSAFESGQLTVTNATQSFGTIGQDQKVSASFPVSLGSVTANEHLFLTLQLQSDSGTLSDRYFMLEVGALGNGAQKTQTIQRLNFDEFHAWHIDVPPGASNLLISTTADNPTGGNCTNPPPRGGTNVGSIDIDLLVRFGQPPEYSIALDPPPEGASPFFVDSNTLVDGNCGGHETVSIPNPQVGTYHIVVVNFDQVQHDYTIEASFDAPAEGSIVFDPADYLVSEGEAAAGVSVTRSGGAGAVSVDYATQDGAATAPGDFVATSGTLNWADGETGSKSIQVSINDDGAFEPDENFTVVLSNPTGGASLGAPATATVTIIDDDNPGELDFTSTAVVTNENSLVKSIGVTRSNGSNGILTVDFASADGSASAGADYFAASGTLSWADGETGEKFFDVTIVDDPLLEADETVLLSISNPSPNVPITFGNATLTINDNDDPGAVSFDQSNLSLAESGGGVTVSVTRSGGDLAGNAAIDYATADGSATAGSDYQASSGTLTWLAGEGGSKTFTVTVSDDNDFEGNEAFSVALSNPSSGLVLNDPSTIGVTIIDDDDPGQLDFASSTQSVGEAIGNFTVTVSRTVGSNGAVDVDYATASGSATSGSDFTAASGTLSWADGDSASKSFTVSITNDTVNENAENFTITLSSPSNGARLGNPSVLTVTINDNDQPAGGGGGGGALGWLGVFILLLAMRRRQR